MNAVTCNSSWKYFISAARWDRFPALPCACNRTARAFRHGQYHPWRRVPSSARNQASSKLNPSGFQFPSGYLEGKKSSISSSVCPLCCFGSGEVPASEPATEGGAAPPEEAERPGVVVGSGGVSRESAEREAFEPLGW